MNVAVTGANGHIGAAVCRHLAEAGHAVRALIFRDDSALRDVDLEKIPGAVNDPESLDRLCRGVEVVVHLAGLISIQGDPRKVVHTTNLEGTRQVLEACRHMGVRRLVHFSSIHAYRVPVFDRVMDETAPLVGPEGFAYERSKSKAQQLVMETGLSGGLETICLNPTSILGPWDVKPSLQGRMLIDLYKGKVPLLPPGGFDWVDNRDVAQAAGAAMCLGKSGEAYILSGRYATVRELVGIFAGISGIPLPRHGLPFWLMKSMAPVMEAWGWISGTPPVLTREAVGHLESGHPGISHQKAAGALGYTVRPLEVTLRDSYDWLACAGYLN